LNDLSDETLDIDRGTDSMSQTKVIMPQMGESIFEGTITKWIKAKGDRVERDEPLFEISTDKVDSEIPSPAAGILEDILVNEGETVEINTVVALIRAPGTSDAAHSGTPARGKAQESPPVVPAPAETPEPAGAPRSKILHSSPLVRRLATEHGVDLEELEGRGTGTGGRITKRDVLSYLEQRQEAGTSQPAPARKSETVSEPGIERVPMTVMRRSIAEHMVASRRTSAHVATVFEVDCSAILSARAALKPEFESSGVPLTVTPFFVQAAVRAIERFPILNSSVDVDTIVYKKAINIGIAVAVEGGLVVPVIRNADRKDLRGLAEAIGDMSDRVRTKQLSPDEVQGGTFTVTNPGNFGGLFGIPIINQPQVAILAIGGIQKRPVVIDDTVQIRPMVYLSLSFDHRTIDGVVADQFMANIQKNLETWDAQ
jgi:pyruvate dehydrogenase E2 component (dihydrolipoamide acetyltransferase)